MYELEIDISSILTMLLSPIEIPLSKQFWRVNISKVYPPLETSTQSFPEFKIKVFKKINSEKSASIESNLEPLISIELIYPFDLTKLTESSHGELVTFIDTFFIYES